VLQTYSGEAESAVESSASLLNRGRQLLQRSAGYRLVDGQWLPDLRLGPWSDIIERGRTRNYSTEILAREGWFSRPSRS
jgi:hypothetical protein